MAEKKITKNNKLRILAAGDLHGSSDLAERLAKKAKKGNVDLVILAGDIHGQVKKARGLIKPFKKNKTKVIFVPGNWDTSEESSSIQKIYDIKNIDGYYVNYKGVSILGIGSPDFALDIDKKESWDKLKKNFERITVNNKKILVSHIHISGSKAEFSGFPGSKILRKAVKKFEPDIVISSHIHEAEGIEELIGKSKIIQVGRNGKILEI